MPSQNRYKSVSHWTEKSLEEMSKRDWRIFREEHRIQTKGGSVPLPARKWEEANLPEWIMKAIQDAKYDQPTGIQMQAIPIGLSGRDILGIAETGSGKTCAFTLPMYLLLTTLSSLASLPVLTS